MASTSKLTATETTPTVTRLRRALARPLPSTSRNSWSLERLCNGGAPPPPPPPPPLPELPPPSLSPPVCNGGAGTGCSITTVDPGARLLPSSRRDGSTGSGSAILACATDASASANLTKGLSTGADVASSAVRIGIILAVLAAASSGRLGCASCGPLKRSSPPNDICPSCYAYGPFE